jgi:predicted metal-dependent enzyme (double-stranded beta helix superfamily)
MTAITTTGTPGINRFSPNQLLRTARLFATDPELSDLVDLRATGRQWRRLDATEHLEIWVLAWPAGSSTGWHDHLESAGAFLAVQGLLSEQIWSNGAAHERLLADGEGRSFGPRHIHQVSNVGDEPALSVHVYSPALTHMTRYAVLDGSLEAASVERGGEDW